MDITSKNLLRSFLIANTNSPTILTSKEKFIQALPKSIDPIIADELFELVLLWNQERINRMENNISLEFNVPEVTVPKGSNNDIVDQRLTLNELVQQMTKLDGILKLQTKEIDNEISRELAILQESVGSLSDLKFGKSTSSNSFNQAIEELAEFDELVKQ
ncbi:hypothetical protein DASC09_054250 [Saccharomycopsis crataegensis]|uniref:Uncharacterized protein n=1 Tax=Saccharomycopsis crataegensis TaxID=43959 RepID=A0AAV5QU31_9ASCO|nr:hypothetical protein DASC09_054250 [Saccharomycopsis crataegensis]